MRQTYSCTQGSAKLPSPKYVILVFSEKGVFASPDKVTAVRQYPVPKNVKDVRAFLGLASFYRRLVPNS
jgi:hypothetical protein